MTCPACAIAEREPLTDEREAGCMGCTARMLVLTGISSLSPGQYHQASRKLFGEQIAEGKELVDKWAKRIRQARIAA